MWQAWLAGEKTKGFTVADPASGARLSG
jgi:hypothetical protein